MIDDDPSPFAANRASTDTPCLCAIALIVSPPCTTYPPATGVCAAGGALGASAGGALGASAGAATRRRTWPGWMIDDHDSPLFARTSAVRSPCRAAIAETVSPGLTV